MKKVLMTLGIIVLMLVAVFWGLPLAEHTNNENIEGSADWMAGMTGSRSLADMYIPGTHDSATKYVQLPFFSKCQTTDITRQLEDGYRYLDIRLGIEESNGESRLALMHGFTYCRNGLAPWSGHLLLDSVLEECYTFLEKHPGETIIFAVKKEHGDESIAEFQQCLKNYTDGNSDKWLLSDEVPTLENARGKIVLFRRYEDEAELGNTAGIPFVWENQPGSDNTALSMNIENEGNHALYVQDRYEYNVQDKWNAFTEGAKKAQEAKYGDIALHFLSTKGTLKFGHPFYFAKKLNAELIKNKTEVPAGWTIFDFATAELAELVYSKNTKDLVAGFQFELSLYNRKIKTGELEPLEPEFREENIHSFLQGPKSWESQIPWSGAWCYEYLEGNYFGAFGCGMCCMANIYDTLAEDKGSPLDAYYFAREKTAYMPVAGNGAIGWGDLKNCLRKMGMVCDLYYKPDTYEEFQREMSMCKSMIVLVSSNEDDTFWKNTKGHYVNIWMYNEVTDKVFLAEPGSPTNNRTWIPLRYVYDALKTISKFQYIRIDGYMDENDQWHPDGITDDWMKPEA